MNTHYLTLGQAAKLAACSKATLSKALKTGALSGAKQPDGSFQIDPAELHRWNGERSTRGIENRTQTPDEPPKNGSGEPLTVLVELAELRVKLNAAERRADDLEKDRDRWAAQAERVSLLLTDQRAAAPSPPAAVSPVEPAPPTPEPVQPQPQKPAGWRFLRLWGKPAGNP